ncbi:MAG: sugar-binding transcriptional regulator [Caldilineaceae bacterium]|nr:sugar-binding transcriptional regulator [Caldilineaceae bacterium]
MSFDMNLLYKIAKAYYEDGLTQNQIGKRLGLSRIKVSRLLQQARQTRVVQITITAPNDSHAELERELEQAFGLDEAVIMSVPNTDQVTVTPILGGAGAAYLNRCLTDGQTIAISWGTTLLRVIDSLTPQNLPDTRVIQMLGGLGSIEAEVYGADLTLRMAQTLGGRMRLLPAPGIVNSPVVRDGLLQDENITETLQKAANADMALVGIGAPLQGSVVLEAGILDEATLIELRAAGAVGDIALRFFDAVGAAVEHPINDRIIGLNLDEIRRIPRVIGVSGGDGKFELIRAAVLGKLINVLITDEATAHRLLNEPTPNAAPFVQTSQVD